MNMFQKIVGDFCDGNIIYVELVSFNKKEQEVEGAFKLFQFNLVIGWVQVEMV